MAGLWPVILFLAMTFLVGGMALAVTTRRDSIPSYEELPDGVLFNNTKDLPEVKAFLAKYPDASVGTDRSGRLAVDYRQDYEEVTLNRSGVEYHPHIRLRIFMSPESEPGEMFVACRDIHDKWSKVEGDIIIGYLQTETCFS